MAPRQEEGWFDKQDRRLLDWLWRSDRPKTGPMGWLHLVAQVIYLSLRNSLQDRLPFQANALSFITLLGLVPALAISFSLAKGLGFAENLRKLLFNEYTMSQSAVLEQILGYVERTQVGTLGAVGLVMLVASLVLTLSSVEETFNRIWEVRSGRTYLRKFTDYLSVLIVCPLLILGSTGMWAAFRSNQFVKFLLDMAVVGDVASMGLQLGPFVMLAAAFILLYIFVPNTKVPWASAAVAGLVAAFFWWVMQSLYIKFQVGVARYNAIYGGFASLPLFFIWLQVSWQVVLFGAELARAHHICRHGPLPAGLFPPLSPSDRQILAFRLMFKVARRFHRGEPPFSLDRLAAELEVPHREAAMVVEDLEEAGMLTDPTCGEGIQFSRDLSTIYMRDMLGAVSGKVLTLAQSGDPALNELLQEVRRSEEKVLGDITLLDLVRRENGAAGTVGG